MSLGPAHIDFPNGFLQGNQGKGHKDSGSFLDKIKQKKHVASKR